MLDAAAVLHPELAEATGNLGVFISVSTLVCTVATVVAAFGVRIRGDHNRWEFSEDSSGRAHFTAGAGGNAEVIGHGADHRATMVAPTPAWRTELGQPTQTGGGARAFAGPADVAMTPSFASPPPPPPVTPAPWMPARVPTMASPEAPKLPRSRSAMWALGWVLSGIIFYELFVPPVAALVYARRARRELRANPWLKGRGMANSALVGGILELIYAVAFWVLVISGQLSLVTA